MCILRTVVLVTGIISCSGIFSMPLDTQEQQKLCQEIFVLHKSIKNIYEQYLTALSNDDFGVFGGDFSASEKALTAYTKSLCLEQNPVESESPKALLVLIKNLKNIKNTLEDCCFG